MTKTKKPKTYEYIMAFNGKSKIKDFYRVMNGLKKRYPKQFVEGDVAPLALNPGFDLVFDATPKQYKNIVATCRRRYMNPSYIVRS